MAKPAPHTKFLTLPAECGKGENNAGKANCATHPSRHARSLGREDRHADACDFPIHEAGTHADKDQARHHQLKALPRRSISERQKANGTQQQADRNQVAARNAMGQVCANDPRNDEHRERHGQDHQTSRLRRAVESALKIEWQIGQRRRVNGRRAQGRNGGADIGRTSEVRQVDHWSLLPHFSDDKGDCEDGCGDKCTHHALAAPPMLIAGDQGEGDRKQCTGEQDQAEEIEAGRQWIA